jgi:hypothetical protein
MSRLVRLLVRFDAQPAPGVSSHPGTGVVASSQLGRATTTMNHSDIRGSEPHDHDSSEATSVQERELATDVVDRIERARILL